MDCRLCQNTGRVLDAPCLGCNGKVRKICRRGRIEIIPLPGEPAAAEEDFNTLGPKLVKLIEEHGKAHGGVWEFRITVKKVST